MSFFLQVKLIDVSSNEAEKYLAVHGSIITELYNTKGVKHNAVKY